MTRGKELLEEARRTYEQLNSELHDELPALYDSRVLFLVTNLQTLFAAEQVFHTESAKVRASPRTNVEWPAIERGQVEYDLEANEWRLRFIMSIDCCKNFIIIIVDHF